ncbi:hypothetical protein K1I93_09805, partial [Streptococcus australis]|uniref:hypothetical protein n=1 Tax=Streptococcus australis TaxID=113107 RepID=UPI001CBC076C
LKNCIDKTKYKTCIIGCRNKCECFKSWIGEKEKEFEKIKEHFGKQEDMKQKKVPPDIIFKYTLKDNFLQDMIEAKGDPNAIKRIKELKEKKNDELENPLNNKTIIEYMLEDDSEEAEDCLNTHKENECPKPKAQDTSLARSETPEDERTQRPASEDDDDDDDDYDEDE